MPPTELVVLASPAQEVHDPVLVTSGEVDQPGGEIAQGENPWWIGWGSLLLAGSGFVPTMMRTVPNARRLGAAKDTAEEQSRLARAVCRDRAVAAI